MAELKENDSRKGVKVIMGKRRFATMFKAYWGTGK